jgi:replicative DNA helicase
VADTNGKILPHNIQAEQSVLGCLMLNYIDCEGGIERLQAADFYSPAHKAIFEAMLHCLEKKDRTIDFVTVVAALRSRNKLEGVGGVAYLNTINDAVPSTSNFRHYYEIVKKNSTLRKLNEAGRKITDSSWAADDEQETLAAAEKIIFDISKEDEKKELTSISLELPHVMEKIVTAQKDPASIFGLKTDFRGIDNLTNGFKGGELIILAARPGVGKTSLGLNMVLNAAKNGKKCAIFSLEMSKTSLTQRALCSLAMVSSYRAGRGEIDSGDSARLWQANDILDTMPIFIDDNSEITPIEIKRKCVRLKREHGLDFIMVDYLGLMTGGTTRYENRQVQVAANSRAMKVLAKELDVPVLLLAQLNRNVETRDKKGVDKQPALHDLRESGAIEQDADVVMFIHMEKPAEQSDDVPGQKAPEAREADIIIAKHRNGPCGRVKVDWLAEFTTFRDQAHKPNHDDKAAAATAKAPKTAHVQQTISKDEEKD